MIDQVFDVDSREWRGFPKIPNSILEIKDEFSEFNAREKYDIEVKDVNDLTWSRWFFPLINTDKGLHEVDLYLQQYLRYLSTGKHTKINYNVRYSKLKEYKYKSLVNEYYKSKEKTFN
mgnify:CR=1 FL=1